MSASRAGVAVNVRNRVLRSRDRFWCPTDFDGSPEAVTQALHRLAASGELLHVRKGLYWRGTKTLLGMAPPPADALVKAVTTERRGVGPAGTSAANALGLSTQIPRRPAFAVPTRIPESVPAGVEMVSRAGCRNRASANARPAEVALLEVLRDWSGLVEIDNAEATGIVKSHLDNGALRADALAKVAGTEPASVRKGLATLLASCGYRSEAANINGAALAVG
jgi:hypothetical protein